jgi:hypothetical protein
MQYIIIRGTANGGKTTTAGILFQKLRQKAEYSKIINYNFEEIEDLKYGSNGNLYDFIGILVVWGKLIIIISKGDVADDLLQLINQLEKEEEIIRLVAGKKTIADIIVCCARSRNRKKSTIEMLYNKVSEMDRSEFWTDYSESWEDRISAKKEVVDNIIEKIESLSE